MEDKNGGVTTAIIVAWADGDQAAAAYAAYTETIGAACRKALALLPKEHAFSFEKDFLQKRTAAGGIYGYHFTTFYTVNDMDQYRDVQDRLASERGYGVKRGRA